MGQARCGGACTGTVAELIRAFTYPKFARSELKQRELLGDYLPTRESVVIREPLDHLPRCRSCRSMPIVATIR